MPVVRNITGNQAVQIPLGVLNSAAHPDGLRTTAETHLTVSSLCFGHFVTGSETAHGET